MVFERPRRRESQPSRLSSPRNVFQKKYLSKEEEQAFYNRPIHKTSLDATHLLPDAPYTPPVHTKTEESSNHQEIIQEKSEEQPNKTGLPDRLKVGVEHLSGYSLDDVRVHYNSPKPAQLQALAYTQGRETVIQRIVYTSGVQYSPTPLDLVFINALDEQIPQAETNARNDVENNPAPEVHTPHQAAYMSDPTPAGWGNCVEEKLNVWAGNNGWNMANNSGGSNPDYSRIRDETTIWADLTTLAETGAGAGHIIDKLNRKVNSGEDDSTWVAADVVHQGLNPLAGNALGVVATNGFVSQDQRNSWQRARTYQDLVDGPYFPIMEKRILIVGPLPSYTAFTQTWNEDQRETFRFWIDEANEDQLDQRLQQSDEE